MDQIDLHQNIVHKVCSMYTDNKDDHQDLFQEILLQLWQAYPRFKGDSKLTTWMYRVALYTAISGFKKKQRIISEGMDSKAYEYYEANDPYRYENLQMAISTLSKADKALVMLYLDEKPYKEIAEILGLTETNVGVKLNRIKKKLKEILVTR